MAKVQILVDLDDVKWHGTYRRLLRDGTSGGGDNGKVGIHDDHTRTRKSVI